MKETRRPVLGVEQHRRGPFVGGGQLLRGLTVLCGLSADSGLLALLHDVEAGHVHGGKLRPLLAGELVGDELTALLGDEKAREFPTSAIGISTGDKKFARLNFELSALLHIFDVSIDVPEKIFVLLLHHLSHFSAVQGFLLCGIVILDVAHDVLLSNSPVYYPSTLVS